MAIETISRILGKFESLNMIEVQGKRINIKDMEALRRIMDKGSK
jgi:CRP-like cAMP-binding protein